MAAVTAAPIISPGASHRPQPSSGVESIFGSSWYSMAVGPCYQMRVILPDAHSIGRREVQLLPRLDREGLVPRVHVADDRRALLGRRVRVGQQPLAEVRLAIVAAPHLRPA